MGQDSLFGPEDIIRSYTRHEAIADGVLVDVSQTTGKPGSATPPPLLGGYGTRW
jgi:hypothetical protein